jgi:hypothetical protein
MSDGADSQSKKPDGTAQSLEERRLEFEMRSRARELALRRRELVLRQAEFRRGKWSSPVVVSLLAAAVALVGNMVVAFLNDRASLESSLIVEAVKADTGNWDPSHACDRLTFLAGAHLLRHADEIIINCRVVSGAFGTAGQAANATARSTGKITSWDASIQQGLVEDKDGVHRISAANCSVELLQYLRGKVITPTAPVNVQFDLALGNEAVNVDLAK